MEKIRRNIMQRRSDWGDMTPGDDAKSGSAQLPAVILDHCQATYNAAAASCLKSTTMDEDPPRQTSLSTNHQSISSQGWSLDLLLSRGDNFKSVQRISAKTLKPQEIERYDESGLPLIIEHLHQHPCWPKEEFNLDWFKANCSESISVRNVIDGSDKEMLTSEFIDMCRAATPALSETDRGRWYGKDVECPARWRDSLEKIDIPDHLLPDKPTDLLSNQPSKERVKTLMCYLGVGDTLTPCHKDPCGSSGQNLMCYTEHGGSSYWFMTETKDVFPATMFFHSIGQELDHEKHVITIEQLAKAPFTIYIAEQKLGDLVLVPSRSCHQVINHGGITIKTSWSRMTFNGLIAAYYHELPLYQRVCREETYRVKFTVYCTIKNLTDKLKASGQGDVQRRRNSRSAGGLSKQKAVLKHLLEVYDDILADERPHPRSTNKLCHTRPSPERLLYPGDTRQDADEYRITCDFCGADIFQSFFECNRCIRQNENIAVCARCYVDGRTCTCGEMIAMQCRSFEALEQARTAAAEALGAKISVKRKSERLGAFGAACLKNLQSDIKAIRKCTAQGDPHEVQKFNSLYYSGYRKTYCFQHLLANDQMHAVDALLQLASVDQQAHHGNNRVPDSDIVKLAESVKHGKRPDLGFQRFHLATIFTTCLQPSQSLRSGYYDNGWGPYPGRTSSINQGYRTHERAASPLVNVQDQQWMSPGSVLTELPSDYEVEPTAPLPSMDRKRKRFVIDFIEVPSLRDLYKSCILIKAIAIQPRAEPVEVMAESHHVAENEAPGSFENPLRDQILTLNVNNDINLSTKADQYEQGSGGKELTSHVDTSVDESASATEDSSERGCAEKPLQGSTARKNAYLRREAKSAGNDGQTRSASHQHRRKRDLAADKRASSREHAANLDIPEPSRVDEPPRTTAKTQVEVQSSGDDSDTVLYHTSPLPDSDGQMVSTPSSPSWAYGNVNCEGPPAAELDPTEMMEDSIVPPRKATKRPLHSRDTWTTGNIGEDSASPSKRRRFSPPTGTRRPQRKGNEDSDNTRANTESNSAGQLVEALTAAWAANQHGSPPTNSTRPRPRNPAEGAESLVVDCREHQPGASRRGRLSEDEWESREKKIGELVDRMAVLEKKLEKQDQDSQQVLSSMRDMLVDRFKEFQAQMAPQFYCVQVPIGQMDGGIFPMKGDVYLRRRSNGVDQQLTSQHNHCPSGPRADLRNRLSHVPQRIYGPNIRHQPWKNRPLQHTTERFRNNRYQEAGPSDAGWSPRRTSPITGRSNMSRYPRQTFGSMEMVKGSSYKEISRAPLVSSSRSSSPGSLRRGQGGLQNEGNGEGHQHGQEQSSGPNWGLPSKQDSGWDWGLPNVIVEEQDSHWEDTYVQEGDGAKGVNTNNGWVSDEGGDAKNADTSNGWVSSETKSADTRNGRVSSGGRSADARNGWGSGEGDGARSADINNQWGSRANSDLAGADPSGDGWNNPWTS